MENTYQSIGLFIDGGYYAKVNEALAAQASLNIDMGSLMYLVRQQVARIGNSVVPIMAKALVQANCPHLIREELSA